VACSPAAASPRRGPATAPALLQPSRLCRFTLAHPSSGNGHVYRPLPFHHRDVLRAQLQPILLRLHHLHLISTTQTTGCPSLLSPPPPGPIHGQHGPRNPCLPASSTGGAALVTNPGLAATSAGDVTVARRVPQQRRLHVVTQQRHLNVAPQQRQRRCDSDAPPMAISTRPCSSAPPCIWAAGTLPRISDAPLAVI
jgi:hypothetical protein